jgi:hypothetical protein
MSPRTIRRAQERQAAKQARKADQQEHPIASTETAEIKSCLITVKVGANGRTMLLPSDEADPYRRHIAAYEAEYQPVGLRECELVQSLADTQWRLKRITALEMAIYAQGHVEFSGTIEAEKIELTTHLKYEKQLRNLQCQEARLLRRYKQEMAELHNLQKERQDAAVSDSATLTNSGSERLTEPRASASGLANSLPDTSASAPMALNFQLPLAGLSCDTAWR